MTAQTITEIVRADDLSEYLARHHLRVVRGGWRWGEKRPYIITGPALPAETNSDEAKGETDGSTEG